MLSRVKQAIEACRFLFKDEAELQQCIAEVLTREGIAFQKEHRLGRDRVDFFVSGLAIEIKVDGSLGPVTRQLFRYSQLIEVTSILLVTSRRIHLRIPRLLSGKPVEVLIVASSGGF